MMTVGPTTIRWVARDEVEITFRVKFMPSKAKFKAEKGSYPRQNPPENQTDCGSPDLDTRF